ncbi:hypothetical protein [Neoroseomonas lacus]|nr:hypothetical protein [Neoroseomonas lacus]
MRGLPVSDQEGQPMTDPKSAMSPDVVDETTAVRQGQTLGSMRWVLLVSLIAVVTSFIVAFAVMPMP